MRLDPSTFLCLLAPVLAVLAVVTALLPRRPKRPIADINPRTGERTDVHH